MQKNEGEKKRTSMKENEGGKTETVFPPGHEKMRHRGKKKIKKKGD